MIALNDKDQEAIMVMSFAELQRTKRDDILRLAARYGILKDAVSL